MFQRLNEKIAMRAFATVGEPVETRYDECGDVRFVGPREDGGQRPYVLLYAEPFGNGLYEIGAEHEYLFDRGEYSFDLWVALLDHIPEDGEVVDEWLRFKEGDEGYELDRAWARASRYLRDNGFRDCYIRTPYH